MSDAFSFIEGDAEHDAYLRVLGVDRNAFRAVQGQSVADWSSRYTNGLGAISGYYDANRVASLNASLGSTTSDTYLKQLSVLAHEANKLYTYASNPNLVRSRFEEASRDPNSGVIYRSWNSGQWAFGFRENQRRDSAYAERALYTAVDAFSKQQDTIVKQLTAQQGAEQGYISQITGLLQQGTLAKTKAEQEAQKKALEQQYAQQQAELNRQAEENARILKEKQEAQTKMFNESSKVTAESNAAKSQLQQAKSAATQVSSVGASRGGEAVSSTNAASKSKTRQTTRTERWQSTRSPATGGGGINV